MRGGGGLKKRAYAPENIGGLYDFEWLCGESLFSEGFTIDSMTELTYLGITARNFHSSFSSHFIAEVFRAKNCSGLVLHNDAFMHIFALSCRIPFFPCYNGFVVIMHEIHRV